MTGFRWVFDQLPPSGARRGGDPSSHAFRHDLETFVREVVQNANDQAVSWPEVRFRFVELREAALERFLEAVSWATLEPHLEAAARTAGGAELGEMLATMRSERRLLLLRVEDRNTEGLTGLEASGESHFRALCKDTLYSHKPSEAAGGSYGLGKSVLWAFSGLSAVVFNSVLLMHAAGQRSPRLIGRAELPSHGTEARAVPGGQIWFSGSGWLGQPTRVRAAERAESVWAQDAERLGEALHIGREDHPGTSILILGFRDPTSERVDAIDDLLLRVRAAAVRSFWPAMTMSRRRLRVRLGQGPGDAGGHGADHGAGGERDELVDVGSERLVRPFVEAFGRRGEPDEELVEPGDVVVRRLGIELPARRGGPAGQEGFADLVVRLAPDGAADPLLGHVALFRGPGMVVRYWDRRRLTLGMRPFHALLICGVARDPRSPSVEDQAMDRFLRDAEPPGHDDWLSTPRLKQHYQRGYASALKRLKDRVDGELRKLLVARPTQGSKGPDRLQKRFPIGRLGAKGEGPPSPFRFRQVQARFDGERWLFEGVIEPLRAEVAWRAELALHELGDDGEELDAVPIASLAIGEQDGEADGEVGHALVAGVARIDAPAGTRRLAFRGASCDLTTLVPGELGFALTGALVEAER